MKTFNVGDTVRLTAKALKLSNTHPRWWCVDPKVVALAKKINLFTVSEGNAEQSYIELDGFRMPWAWNPELFTKRGIHQVTLS